MIIIVTTDPAGKNFANNFDMSDATICHSKCRNGELVDSELVLEKISKADFVLFDIPSLAVDQERQILFLESMRGMKIPFGFYLDTFDVHLRPYLNDQSQLYGTAKVVFIPSELMVQDVSLRFPNSDIQVVGNPEWEKLPDQKSRIEVRNNLCIGDDDTLILSPGTKFLHLNNHLWCKISDAIAKANRTTNSRLCLFCSRHPGDTSPKNAYTSLVTENIWVSDSENLSATQIIPGADLTIGFISGIALLSARMGTPVIEMRTGPLINRKRELIGDGPESFPVRSGAYSLFGDEDGELIDRIALLLDPYTEEHKKQLEAARRTFPTFDEGTCVRKVLNTLKPYA